MNLERMQLEYLARAYQPIWGGHIKRGEPITDPDMQRWLDQGWIEVVGTDGYRITDKGRKALQQKPEPPTLSYFR
jgi:DNA-binding PadR family transcriptional regulator